MSTPNQTTTTSNTIQQQTRITEPKSNNTQPQQIITQKVKTKKISTSTSNLQQTRIMSEKELKEKEFKEKLFFAKILVPYSSCYSKPDQFNSQIAKHFILLIKVINAQLLILFSFWDQINTIEPE
eukprot:TRINITY_DN2149_c0_g1_i13.p1 TRINITY_DN2149_c0_g1~~TRINITY_DN2149_c0_g1_i13.p1  ORF type:complete len:125 (+),score=42.38 TRINITY_DN2149_c0_g1_i13:94-468(+)